MSLQLVHNSDLVFKGPFNVASRTVLELSNSGNERIAFKTKTTAPTRYCVKPNKEFLEPHTSTNLRILLQPPRTSNQQDDRAKHKFMIQWTVVPSSYTGDAESFWKQDASQLKDVQESKIKCCFVDAQSDNKRTQSVTNRQNLKSTIELGYLDSERVVGGSPGSELICSICHNVFWKPIACTTCENAFCAGCIRKWLDTVDVNCQKTCPFHCTFVEKRIPPVLNSPLSNLQIYCIYRNNGCQELLNYHALESHEQTCEYERVACSVCQTLVSPRDPMTDKHEIRQCFAHAQEMQIGNQVQTQLMMLLNVIDVQNKRIKTLEDRLNNMSP